MHRRPIPSAVRWLALAGLFALIAVPASAQSFPGSAESDTTALVKELNSLLDRGEQERLIDPWFLRDLRAAISRYDRPWTEILLSDDFSARGPQPDPPWQVTNGEFLIDWRHGLRSVIEKTATAAAPSGSSSQTDEKDLGKALLGALLQGALQGQQQNGGSQQSQPAQTGPSFSAIQAPIRLSNAFAIDITLSLRALPRGGDDGFELGPYPGRQCRQRVSSFLHRRGRRDRRGGQPATVETEQPRRRRHDRIRQPADPIAGRAAAQPVLDAGPGRRDGDLHRRCGSHACGGPQFPRSVRWLCRGEPRRRPRPSPGDPLGRRPLGTFHLPQRTSKSFLQARAAWAARLGNPAAPAPITG